jgi:hypothetical protein
MRQGSAAAAWWAAAPAGREVGGMGRVQPRTVLYISTVWPEHRSSAAGVRSWQIFKAFQVRPCHHCNLAPLDCLSRPQHDLVVVLQPSKVAQRTVALGTRVAGGLREHRPRYALPTGAGGGRHTDLHVSDRPPSAIQGLCGMEEGSGMVRDQHSTIVLSLGKVWVLESLSPIDYPTELGSSDARNMSCLSPP